MTPLAAPSIRPPGVCRMCLAVASSLIGRQAEVEDPAVLVGVDHDVRGLHVAVDDPGLVGVVQGVARVGHDLGHGAEVLRRERSVSRGPRAGSPLPSVSTGVVSADGSPASGAGGPLDAPWASSASEGVSSDGLVVPWCLAERTTWCRAAPSM